MAGKDLHPNEIFGGLADKGHRSSVDELERPVLSTSDYLRVVWAVEAFVGPVCTVCLTGEGCLLFNGYFNNFLDLRCEGERLLSFDSCFGV